MSWKSLAWSAAAIVLLLTLATPLNFITVFLVMTPFVVLYAMLDWKSFVLHLLPIGLIAFLLSGALGPLLVTAALYFLVPAIAMGHLYKRGSLAKSAVTAGFVIVLAQILFVLVLFSLMLDIDIKAQLTAKLADYFQQFDTARLIEAGWTAESAAGFSSLFKSLLMMNQLPETGWAAEAASTYIGFGVSILPTLLFVFIFLFVVISHALSRLALRSVPFDAPALPQAKTWRLPKSLVLYFVIALIAVAAMSEESSGYWRIAISNLVPILELAFTIQAIGFVFFLSDLKKWPRAISLLLCLPILLIPSMFIIGLLDTAFPIRKSFEK
ncbi:DUF2232 domain-containing protein [Cohnella cellulosilytica]|uniref:DUF2232 domain-containing protein n=1 Tax=Cohnella cellulosilytica TaxID=986710 RepID=A0ABW2FB61_9BACL